MLWHRPDAFAILQEFELAELAGNILVTHKANDKAGAPCIPFGNGVCLANSGCVGQKQGGKDGGEYAGFHLMAPKNVMRK